MNRLILSLCFAVLMMAAAVPAARAQAALPDTPANRDAQADRYLAATPPKEYFADMAKKMAVNIPEGPQRDSMVRLFTTGLDMDAMTKAMKAGLVKRFTAEELKALADFYSSPVGKSAMGKMSDYVADLMPVIQEQVMKGMSKSAPTP